ncbi:diguanylate cyclase/phosphodiesterase (GGDEF & EAL domains) with PAS/PAC sensor(s) [Pseudoalteromonas luteoviolacea B = ATCC 29581]|nr:diguanylate cyclase/phosphodiesterase (GGDEF & EAL domains) with PAS/PAC sensor(s) [Pseudoalteromonas luteoviolacea B = ATCC 29581]
MNKFHSANAIYNHLKKADSLTNQLDYAVTLFKQTFNVDGIALWILNAPKTAYECEYYSGSQPSNLGKFIAVDKIPPSLLSLKRFNLFTSLELMCAEELAFLASQRALGDNAVDYILIPIAPGKEVIGFISIRSNNKVSEWESEHIDTLLLVVSQLKESVMRDRYEQLSKACHRESFLLDEIQKIAKVGGWQYDLQNGELYWSDETYRIYGYPVGSEIDPSKGISHYLGEDQQTIANDFDALINQQKPYTRELRFIDAKGKFKWVRTSGRLRTQNGKALYAYGAFEDITILKDLIIQEQDAHRYLATVIDNLNDVIVTISEDGIILTANSKLKAVFGYEPHELIGQNVACLMPSPYKEMHQQYIQSYLKTGKAQIIGLGRELPAIKKNNEIFPIELALTEVKQGEQRIFIGIVKDISERKTAEDKLYKLAYFSPLTNLPNAFSFEEQITKHIEKVRLVNGRLLVIKIDIDNFSKINLAHSRKAGDYAISMIADRLRLFSNDYFELYHLRGDIFYLVSRNSQQKTELELRLHCDSLATQIKQQLANEVIIEGMPYRLSASIVSAIIDGEYASVEVLYELLAMAVKRLKLGGGNQHTIVDNHAHQYLERRARIKSMLPSALLNNEFFLVLQPQFDIHKQYTSSEVLIRWNSKEFGFISPGEFIEIAEESGDIIAIGYWILEQVAKLLSLQQPKGRLAINISAKQLAKPEFEETLFHYFTHYNVSLKKIILEVTETTLVQDLEQIREKLKRLTALGIEFSIDDFGTGYSSLSYLQNLGIHEIKIDKSFIDEIDGVTPVPIVDSIIQLANSLGARVVAEGVENQTQFDYLVHKECDVIQGYLLSKPLPIEDWVKVI